MIDIKQAVKAAEQYLHKLYGEPIGVQLEEVYLSDGDGSWLVTLSFLAPVPPEEGNLFAAAMIADRFVRKYKTFDVDRTTGEVRSMKIRPVPSV